MSPSSISNCQLITNLPTSTANQSRPTTPSEVDLWFKVSNPKGGKDIDIGALGLSLPMVRLSCLLYVGLMRGDWLREGGKGSYFL